MNNFAAAKRRCRLSSLPQHIVVSSPGDSHWHANIAAVRQIIRGPRLQAKLTIGAPDDVYEQEADRVADAVMRMPEPKVQKAPT